MKNEAQKNILFLAIAGVVLVALNVGILMATKNGSLAPIENLTLWGAFVVLNISSLLWAVSLLGLQPLVIAFSYLAGGFVAFLGVRLLPEVNVAEVTTAGATYGAFGALAVGNVTTKVRLAFFDKKQVPFVFVIAALLLMDGFLNSSVSNAGLGVVVNALVLPFVISGVIVGLIWAGLARFGIGEGFVPSSIEAMAGAPREERVEAIEENQIMFQTPDTIDESEEQEPAVAMVVMEPVDKPEALVEPEPIVMEIVEGTVSSEPVEEDSVDENNFFPLEIDKEDEIILPQEELQSLASVIGVAEYIPEPIVEPTPVQELEVVAEEPPVLEVEVASEPEEKKDSSQDWLSGHMDLLNNIKKAS